MGSRLCDSLRACSPTSLPFMAGIEIRVIDRRLGESFDPPKPHDLVVGPNSDLDLLFADIFDQSHGTLIENLILMSHALYQPDAGGQHHFGFGIELGKQNITLVNAAGFFSRLAHRFASNLRGIELRGCGVAAYSRVVGAAGVVAVGDGLSLCQAIANAAQTGVLASPKAQSGECKVTPTAGMRRSGATITPTADTEVGRCTLGSWTGQVWNFLPNGPANGSGHVVYRR
ncbi:MAG: hypothetical protein H7345_01300 [Rubritepida sp.]|nr:hypothetical protein [Rubritepida sp.]